MYRMVIEIDQDTLLNIFLNISLEHPIWKPTNKFWYQKFHCSAVNNQSDYPFAMKRLQFPIQLAYAMTFNQAQGQSVQKCGLLLENKVLHMVTSSILGYHNVETDPRNVSIFVLQDEFKTNHKANPEETYTRNIVYKEVF